MKPRTIPRNDGLTPRQLRSIADARLMARNKSQWADLAAQALTSAAAELEKLQQQVQHLTMNLRPMETTN